MDTATAASAEATPVATHLDVLIIGAGISGIDKAYHLRQALPGRSFAVLETKSRFGGTWQQHRGDPGR